MSTWGFNEGPSGNLLLTEPLFDEIVWDDFEENGDHFVFQQYLLRQNQWASQDEERSNLQHGFISSEPLVLGVSQFSTSDSEMITGHQEDAKSDSLLEFGWDHSNSLQDIDTLFRTRKNVLPQVVNESSYGIPWTSFPSTCGRSSQINMVNDNSPIREIRHPLDSSKLQELGQNEMPLWSLENRIIMAPQENYSINQSIYHDEKWVFEDANDQIQDPTEININDGGDMEAQVLQEFQSSTAKLDARTQTCIKNALYRLANSATKRHGISGNGDDSHNEISHADTWNDELYSSERHSFILKHNNIPSGVFP